MIAFLSAYDAVVALIVAFIVVMLLRRKRPKVSQPPKFVPYFDSGNPELREDIIESLLRGERIFLSGGAGTGKTYLVKSIAKSVLVQRELDNYSRRPSGSVAGLTWVL
ncbi:MAG: hypothetical protein JW955_00520 [Sedimentisphaerales bacterium]|nr:hypothetical protein [Sedimentisphaerales bacterium]